MAIWAHVFSKRPGLFLGVFFYMHAIFHVKTVGKKQLPLDYEAIRVQSAVIFKSPWQDKLWAKKYFQQNKLCSVGLNPIHTQK